MRGVIAVFFSCVQGVYSATTSVSAMLFVLVILENTMNGGDGVPIGEVVEACQRMLQWRGVQWIQVVRFAKKNGNLAERRFPRNAPRIRA